MDWSNSQGEHEELNLPGIAALTPGEKIQRLLDEDPALESRASIAAYLAVRDASDRKDRAERWRRVRDLQAAMLGPSGALVPGGHEALWLRDEASGCYVTGHYVAAIVCGHAACERIAAGALHLLNFEERGWEFWGLPKLASAAERLHVIGPRLRDALIDLSERRKVTAHYKPPMHPDAVMNRALATLADDESDAESALERVLREDAYLAVTLSTLMAAGSPGFQFVELPLSC